MEKMVEMVRMVEMEEMVPMEEMVWMDHQGLEECLEFPVTKVILVTSDYPVLQVLLV